MTAKELVKEIGKRIGKELHEAPTTPDSLTGLMAFDKNGPKYAVEGEQLIGLNLAVSGLNDSKWQEIVGLLGQKVSDLQALNLNDNKLTSFPSSGKFLSLKRLDLSENKLKEFTLEKGIGKLYDLQLRENPDMTNPPPEIVSQGSAGILSWLDSFKPEVKGKAAQVHYLKEIKVLLVGEGFAGKTSLLKQLKGLKFSQHESMTHGVNVETLDLEKLPRFQDFENLKGVHAHFWDFGGQEIMHASHQFFLTHRSVYLLVHDTRTDGKLDYWLRHIEKFGGGSPAILAANKIDENPNFTLEEKKLNRKYPFLENRFIKISCKKNDGLDRLARTLAEVIPSTPLFNTPFSEDWLAVKNELETKTAQNKYIDRDGFVTICENHGVKDSTAQKTLLGFLNALGVVLHFERLELQEFYVLDPHWVTIGVYKIINSPTIQDGILFEKDLDFILNKEKVKIDEYDPHKDKPLGYKPRERLYLVSIMRQFELLYEYQDGEWLVPDLLPKEPLQPVVFDHSDSLHFIMTYDFLPTSIMSRFLIQMKDEVIDRKQLWRSGALLYNKRLACTALITADIETRKICIDVNGKEGGQSEYFNIIRHQLWAIHDNFRGLEVKEWMPLPDHPEHLVEYERLLRQEKAGRDEYYDGMVDKTYSIAQDFFKKMGNKEERTRDLERYEQMKAAREQRQHTIQELVADGRMKDAIDIVLKQARTDNNTDLQHDSVELLRRYNENELNHDRRAISDEGYKDERSRISYRLLQLSGQEPPAKFEVPSPGAPPTPPPPPIEPNKPWYKRFWVWLLAIIGFFALLGEATGYHLGKILQLVGLGGWD